MATPPPPPPSLPPPLPPAPAPNPDGPPEGYRDPSRGFWWRQGLFLVGMPVELRQTVTVKKPWFTWSLSVLLILFSLGFWTGDPVWMPLVFNPASTGPDYWIGAFGHSLLHLDPPHLLGNIYFLLIFGNNVECRFGRRRTIGLFFTACASGAVLHGLASPLFLVGASGGIFGILIFYALQFPHARILWLPLGWMVNAAMLVFGRPLVARGFSVRTYLVIYLIVQMLLLHEQLFQAGNVSALAHLGGGFAGAAIWVAWRKNWLP